MNKFSIANLFEKHAYFLRKHSFKFLSIGVSLIALITAMVIHKSAEQKLSVAKAMLQQQQAMNSEADQSAILLSGYLGPYKAFQHRKVIAPPARLQWLETLQAAVDENLIPKLTFVLSPTAPASAENTIYLHETISVKVTPMRLEFVLMHEGDMLRLLNDLHTQASGEFSVESCELARNEEYKAAAESMLSRETFKGACDLKWYSLSDITSAWEVPHESQ